MQNNEAFFSKKRKRLWANFGWAILCSIGIAALIPLYGFFIGYRSDTPGYCWRDACSQVTPWENGMEESASAFVYNIPLYAIMFLLVCGYFIYTCLATFFLHKKEHRQKKHSLQAEEMKIQNNESLFSKKRKRLWSNFGKAILWPIGSIILVRLYHGIHQVYMGPSCWRDSCWEIPLWESGTEGSASALISYSIYLYPTLFLLVGGYLSYTCWAMFYLYKEEHQEKKRSPQAEDRT